MIAETSGSCIVVFTGDSTILYSVVEYTVNVTRVKMVKDAFIATNLVLVPITSGLRVPCLKVPGHGSLGPGSKVLILEYAIHKYLFI